MWLFFNYRLMHSSLFNIGIYLHSLTNNEREIAIPHEALQVRYWKFPDNSRAVRVLTFSLFKLNTLHKETLANRQILRVVCWIYTTIMTSRRLFRHNPVQRVQISQSKNRNSYSVLKLNYNVIYLTIIPWARVGYEMIDSQWGAQRRVGYNHLISNTSGINKRPQDIRQIF